jgi:DNA end-binding protein Ku
VLFRRVRTLLIRAEDSGLLATTLNFDYAVRSAKDAFSDIPEMKIKGEMLDLAKHIIETKYGTFDPSEYKDRYEAALAELVKAKLEGKPIPARKPAKTEKVVDLMQALRESAGVGKKPAATKKAKAEPARRKAS